MQKNLSSFGKQLMLDEITFFSLCNDFDRSRILDKAPMTFDDFRRLSLLTDYLELKHLNQFIWDMHAHKFADEIDDLYEKCTVKGKDIPGMLYGTKQWLDDFWKHAPNTTVAYLLREIFSEGLPRNNKVIPRSKD